MELLPALWREGGGGVSFEARCDLCGIPLCGTETLNVFRMWNGVRTVQIEDAGLQGVPYDENFTICDDCMEKAYDALVKIYALKVVDE